MERKVALYARVSTSQQADTGFGLDVQLKELRALADANSEDYVEFIDRGISGTNIEKRFGLQDLLEEVKKNTIKEIWVTKLSRLGRNSRDVLNIIYEFEKFNVQFKSIKDGIDTSNNMGKIMLQFMAIIAEMERDVIIETTRAGAEYRATVGKIYGGPPTLGYDRKLRDKETYFEVNLEEAETVKRIFSLYLGGHGYKAIVTRINNEGHRTKHNNLFTIDSVKVILENPLYAGKIRYNYHKDWNKKRRRGKQTEYILVDGLHDAIIDEDDFNKTQAKINENVKGRNPRSGKFLLNSVLKCPECGVGMVAAYRYRYLKTGRKRIRGYTCGAYHNKGRKACKANLVNADDVEKIVLKRVSEHINSEETVNLLHTYIKEQSKNKTNIEKLLKTFDDDIENFEKKIERVKEMYEDGFIPKKAMIHKIEKHNKDIEDIKDQKQALKQDKSDNEVVPIDITKEEIHKILQSLYQVFTTSSDRLLIKDFLRIILKEIKVKNRLKPDMDISLTFSENLLKLFDKDYPKGLTFSVDQDI